MERRERLKTRELDVYKKAFKAALRLHEYSDMWPVKTARYNSTADQIQRASKGICANLVEGLSKRGDAEQRRFLNMALGSAREVQIWAEFDVGLRYEDEAWGRAVDETYEEIARMLVGLMQKRGT